MILLIYYEVFSPVLDFSRRLFIFFIISWRLAVNPDIYIMMSVYCFILVHHSLQVPLCLIQLFPFVFQLFSESFLPFLQNLDVQLFAISRLFGRHFVSLLLVKWFSRKIIYGTSILGSHIPNLVDVFIFVNRLRSRGQLAIVDSCWGLSAFFWWRGLGVPVLEKISHEGVK